MIGLSFSRCVAEIAAGKVAIDDVEKIYSRTATADWEKTIEDYKSYWENVFPLVRQDDLSDENRLLFVGKCQQIAKEILPKVFQPRIENNKYPDCNRSFWVQSEDEIVWQDDNTKVAQDTMDWVTEEDLSVFVLPECKDWNALEKGQTLSVKITGRNNWADKFLRDLPEGMLPLYTQMHLVLLENVNEKSVFWKVQATIGSSSRIGFLSAYGLSPLYLLSFDLEVY